jgi:hypothetical protein
MKGLAFVLAIGFGASTLTGCLIHDHGRRNNKVVTKEKRGCPPAHHWEGGACVHNGKAKGHKK